MNELENLLTKMISQTCWSMIGVSGGSRFSLDFGAQVKREIIIGNDMLRKDQREYVGEYGLFVQSSGWRLRQGSELICDCNDSNANDGPMVLGLRKLEGKKMLRFKFRDSHAELTIAFSENYRLFLCDWEGVESDQTAYTVFGDGVAASVEMNGTVKTEPSKLRAKKREQK